MKRNWTILTGKKKVTLYPFHSSMLGMADFVICREDGDYDVAVKQIFITAHRMGVKVVNYAVVSNHIHVFFLADSEETADRYVNEIKKAYSMYIRHKYGFAKSLREVPFVPVLIEDDRHLRNALAYDSRNALDNSDNIETYPWTGHSAFFRDKSEDYLGRPVSSLTTRESEAIFRTNEDISGTGWRIDGEQRLIPRSCCFHEYLEKAFCNDQTYYYKTLGLLNKEEADYELMLSPNRFLKDADLLQETEEKARKWTGKGLAELTMREKVKMIRYIIKSHHTTPKQLARVLALPLDLVRSLME